AGTFARWLMPWFYLVFMASPLSYLIDIRRKLRVFLYYNLALFLLRLIAIWGAGTWLGDPVLTVQVFSLVGGILTGGQLAYLLWLGGVWGQGKSR
ncbi:MAG: polysaccharide biosynthesis protein, partial [Bacteroidetes bacterium]